MRKCVRIIYNLILGKEFFKCVLLDVLIKFEKVGYEMSVYVIEKIGDVIFEVERVLESEYDLFIVVGGDGMLNEVVNGIVE